MRFTDDLDITSRSTIREFVRDMVAEPLLVLGWGAIVREIQGKLSELETFLPSDISMADVDETAKLWKVNRTIHELVKDRVSYVRTPPVPNSYPGF